MGLFWDLAQDDRLDDVERTAASTRQLATDLETRCTQLEEKVERLTFLTQAMWEILSDRLGISDRDLLAWAKTLRPIPLMVAPQADELYGPPPPPPVVICTNCNTRFQAFGPVCPSCGCHVPVA